jgi:DNA-binding NtrC family response regulator
MFDTDHMLQLYLSGTSQKIAAVRETIQRVIAWPTTSRPPHLVIEGESSTGKSLLAMWLHRNSARAERPFVRIYFPTTPPYAQIYYVSPISGAGRPQTEQIFNGERTIVQAAKGGTLVLDKPWLARKKIQVMLRAAIKELDASIITETNRSLELPVSSGDLREDLYLRLAQVRIGLPPLREHREVILPLAEYHLEQHCQAYGLSPRTLEPDARSALLAYPWPNNIGELDNVLERIILLCPGATLTAAHLAAALGTASPLDGAPPPAWWIGPTPGPWA